MQFLRKSKFSKILSIYLLVIFSTAADVQAYKKALNLNMKTPAFRECVFRRGVWEGMSLSVLVCIVCGGAVIPLQSTSPNCPWIKLFLSFRAFVSSSFGLIVSKFILLGTQNTIWFPFGVFSSSSDKLITIDSCLFYVHMLY